MYTNDEDIRRAYWTEQVEAAHDFIEEIREYPVSECGEKMVLLRQAVKDARLTVKFSDTKIAGKYDRVFYLREGIVKKVLAIAKELNDRGWFLKVEDCFRTRNMQKHVGLQDGIFDAILEKVIWENNGEIPSPELLLRRFTVFSATAPKIAPHISGGAIDISVYQACNLSKLDRGGQYLEISELTFMDSPFISDEAAANRSEINKILEKHGFTAYPFEFWHFSQGDAYSEYLTKSGKDAKYGAINFDLTSGQIVPLDNSNDSLYSVEEIQKKIESALARIKEM